MRLRRDKTFRFGHFRVVVHASILKKWAAVSGDEKCAIIASAAAAYGHYNAQWRSALSAPTREGIRSILEMGNLALRTYEAFAKKKDESLDEELKTRVLWLLQFARYREWNRSPIAGLFQQAVGISARDGDASFFKALGERLKEKPIPFKAPRSLTQLKAVILDHWFTEKGICFCWFSDKALADFLDKTTSTYYMPEAIRKARERLQLAKLRHPLVRVVRSSGDQIHLA